MNLKVTPESYGGFLTFDVICIYGLLMFLKSFTASSSTDNDTYIFIFVTLILVYILSDLDSEFSNNTVVKLIKTCSIFIFARNVVLECARDASFHSRIVSALKKSYIVALSFVFIQMAVGLQFTFYPQLSENTVDSVFHIIRYPGMFYDSQASGQFLVMGSFLFLNIKEIPAKKVFMQSYLPFCLSLIGIVFAGSRSAMAGLAAGLLLIVLTSNKKVLLYASCVAVICGLVMPKLPNMPGVFTRNENISQDYQFRQTIWNGAIEIAGDHPLLGIGSGNYQRYVTKHLQDQYLELEDGTLLYFDQPENGYLKILAELGIFGFLIYMMFIILPVRRAIMQYLYQKTDSGIKYPIAAIVSWLVAFNTVYSIADNRILIMLTCLILLVYCYPSKGYPSYAQSH